MEVTEMSEKITETMINMAEPAALRYALRQRIEEVARLGEELSDEKDAVKKIMAVSEGQDVQIVRLRAALAKAHESLFKIATDGYPDVETAEKNVNDVLADPDGKKAYEDHQLILRSYADERKAHNMTLADLKDLNRRISNV